MDRSRYLTAISILIPSRARIIKPAITSHYIVIIHLFGHGRALITPLFSGGAVKQAQLMANYH